MKKFLVVYFIVVFIISSFVVVNVRGDVLIDSRMGHQKDNGYRSERLAVDVVPGMVVRPEVRCSNDRGSSNRHNQGLRLQRKDSIGPDAWNRPFVDPWNRKFVHPWSTPIYGHKDRAFRNNRHESPRHCGDRYTGFRNHNRNSGLKGGLHR
jgi:hypothetical protein